MKANESLEYACLRADNPIKRSEHTAGTTQRWSRRGLRCAHQEIIHKSRAPITLWSEWMTSISPGRGIHQAERAARAGYGLTGLSPSALPSASPAVPVVSESSPPAAPQPTAASATAPEVKSARDLPRLRSKSAVRSEYAARALVRYASRVYEQEHPFAKLSHGGPRAGGGGWTHGQSQQGWAAMGPCFRTTLQLSPDPPAAAGDTARAARSHRTR